MVWTKIYKKHLRNISGSNWRNFEKHWACLGKRVSLKKSVLQETQVKNCNPDYLWFKFNKSHNPHNHNPHNVASDFKFSKCGCMDYVDLSNWSHIQSTMWIFFLNHVKCGIKLSYVAVRNRNKSYIQLTWWFLLCYNENSDWS